MGRESISGRTIPQPPPLPQAPARTRPRRRSLTLLLRTAQARLDGDDSAAAYAVLEPGDLLYIPPFWLHSVESLSSELDAAVDDRRLQQLLRAGFTASVNMWSAASELKVSDELAASALPFESSWALPERRAAAILYISSMVGALLELRGPLEPPGGGPVSEATFAVMRLRWGARSFSGCKKTLQAMLTRSQLARSIGRPTMNRIEAAAIASAAKLAALRERAPPPSSRWEGEEESEAPRDVSRAAAAVAELLMGAHLDQVIYWASAQDEDAMEFGACISMM